MDAAYEKYFSSSGSGKTGIEDGGRTETPSRQKRQRSPQRARRNLVQELEESAAELNSSVQDQRQALDNALAAGRLLLKRKAEKRVEALRRLKELAAQSIEDVDQHAAEVINALIVNKDNPEKVASIIEEEEPVSAVIDRVAKAVASDQPIEPREIEKLEQAAQEKAIPEERQAAAQALRTIRADGPVQQVPPPPNEEEVMLRAFHRELTAIVKRALAPLVTFASMVGVKMNQQDFRMMLSFHQDQPSIEVRLERVVEWAPTMDSYIAANAPSLGRPFLTAFARHFGRLYALQGPLITVQNRIPFGLGDVRDIQRTAASGYSLDTLRETYNNSRELAQQDPQNEQFKRDAENALRAYTAARLLNEVSQAGNELFVDFSPAWCWELLSVTIFQKLLSMSSMAAIEAAHSVVQRIPGCASFGIKELILSTDVNDQFAFLVASQFLSASEGFATTRGRVKRNNAYINIMHMRHALASQVHTCQVWFEIHVRRVPSTLPRKFDEERARLFPGGVGEPADGDLDNFRNQLPKWELAFFK